MKGDFAAKVRKDSFVGPNQSPCGESPQRSWSGRALRVLVMTMMGIIMTMVGNADDADEDEHHDGDE